MEALNQHKGKQREGNLGRIEKRKEKRKTKWKLEDGMINYEHF